MSTIGKLRPADATGAGAWKGGSAEIAAAPGTGETAAPPAVDSNLGAALNEGATVVLTSTMLNVVDAESPPSGVTYTITTASANGTLFLNGSPLGAGDTFTQDDIDNGRVSWTHDGGETVSDSFSFDVSDADGESTTGHSFGFDITPVDDDGTAQDDAVSTQETGFVIGSLFDDNGSGPDVDPDGALTIVEIDGVAASVGQTITLASGALLTVEADGTYSYDPNGRFTALGGPASGAANQTATDSFTYTLSDGDTATVTVTIQGEDGDGDVLTGTAGDDALAAGDGDDTIRSSAGNDALDGGDGIDTADYSGAAAGVEARLDLGAAASDGDGGSDTLANIENLTGSAFADYLVGDAGDNEIEGGDGADVLIGRAGDDVLTGGLGMDVLIGQEGNDTLFGGSGAANQLQGGLGDDTYLVTAHDTIVEFDGEGEDTVQTTNLSQTLAANLENLLYLGAGAFTGIGNDLNNVVMGGSGNDVVMGRGGADVLMGQGGNDTASYALAFDRVVASLADGTASDDGDGGSDVFMDIENLTGSDWDDDLFGDAGVNILNGGAGDDLLAGGAGNDVLRGGDGLDIADYTASTAGIVLSLNSGVAHDGLGGTDLVISVEEVWGSAYNDVVLGSAGDDWLSGEAGRDVLVGGAGDDILVGGDGDPNQLQGGLGDDRYLVTANDTLVEFSGEGHDTVVTTTNRMTLRANFEDMQFIGDGDFVGTGNAEDNVIVGGDGDDVLTGGQGDDVLVGFITCGCDGGGLDTVVLSGNQADYDIEDLGGGQYVITDTVAGRDGVDILIDMDQIRFADGVLALVPEEPEEGLAAAPDQNGAFRLPDHMLTVDQIGLFAGAEDSGRLHDWFFPA